MPGRLVAYAHPGRRAGLIGKHIALKWVNHSRKTKLLCDPRVAAFTGTIVAVDQGDAVYPKAKFLAGGKAIDMFDRTNTAQHRRSYDISLGWQVGIVQMNAVGIALDSNAVRVLEPRANGFPLSVAEALTDRDSPAERRAANRQLLAPSKQRHSAPHAPQYSLIMSHDQKVNCNRLAIPKT